MELFISWFLATGAIKEIKIIVLLSQVDHAFKIL